MKAKHAPTPYGCVSTSNHAHDYRLTAADGSPLAVNAEGNDHSEQRATAAFIVRACNSHDALVSALDECERILYARHADTLSPGGREALRAVNAARAALTLARG